MDESMNRIVYISDTLSGLRLMTDLGTQFLSICSYFVTELIQTYVPIDNYTSCLYLFIFLLPLLCCNCVFIRCLDWEVLREKKGLDLIYLPLFLVLRKIFLSGSKVNPRPVSSNPITSNEDFSGHQ